MNRILYKLCIFMNSNVFICICFYYNAYDVYMYAYVVKHFKEMNSNVRVGMTMVKKES